VPSAAAAKTTPKFIYMLNADDFDPATLPKDAFIVYQGHHGDLGAQYADICLPGSAYTEKASTWINTEGRTQLGRAAVPAPGAARDDWKTLRAVSEVMGQKLPYDDTVALRDRMWDISPTLLRYDQVETPDVGTVEAGLKDLARHAAAVGKSAPADAKQGAFKKPIADFYLTDSIARSSVTMSQCSKAYTHGERSVSERDEELPQASYVSPALPRSLLIECQIRLKRAGMVTSEFLRCLCIVKVKGFASMGLQHSIRHALVDPTPFCSFASTPRRRSGGTCPLGELVSGQQRCRG
jgi:NADH dehydrogenase (ubiquinone) Fe-S protein 1